MPTSSISDSFSISSCVPRVVIYNIFSPDTGKALVLALLAPSPNIELISRSSSPSGCVKSHCKRIPRLLDVPAESC